MSIKKVTIDENNGSKKYPYVGIQKYGKDMSVLFCDEQEGVVVDSNREMYPVGTFRSDWIEENFKPINATIEFGV